MPDVPCSVVNLLESFAKNTSLEEISSKLSTVVVPEHGDEQIRQENVHEEDVYRE